MNETNEPVGRASLWTSLIGLVLPLTLAILVTAFAEHLSRRDTAFLLCVVLFGVLELAALVCGILGRDTRSGKAGLTLSSLLFIALLLFVVVGIGFFAVRVGPSPVTRPIPSEAAKENVPERVNPPEERQLPEQPKPPEQR